MGARLYDGKRSGCAAHTGSLRGARHSGKRAGAPVRRSSVHDLQYAQRKEPESRRCLYSKTLRRLEYQRPGVFRRPVI